MTGLQARDKVVFINGDFLRPNAHHADHKRWVFHSSDAFGLWEEIRHQFGGCIGPRLYEIRRYIYYTKQGRDFVACFYNKLKTLWKKLMSLKPAMRFGDFEEENMMLFLMGLNEDYKATRSQILLSDPLPNLAKAYGMITNVENC
ncbi:hypothetical protein LIER_43811 [Lithospermum erythrorhizon]|uniref:Retrotransposon gag domain-containing protein n=1 Tax=Lithospermum erythrorhizon TaxID=34254 RepID=A0AAV3QWS5_LITER